MQQKRTYLVTLLYFIQKMSYTITSTIALTYERIPNYFVLSIFELSYLPFSAKFLFGNAPIIEKYSSLTYGRRKTWVVGACSCMVLFLGIFSLLTDYQYVVIVAWLALVHVSFSAVQDVALDALALKEIQQPQKISLSQQIGTNFGTIFGGFVFLKLVSDKFGKFLGLNHGILSVSSFILIASLLVLIVVLYTHFTYKQKALLGQMTFVEEDRSLLQTFKQYKVFFQINRKQCRQSIYFLIVHQGIFFFSKSYRFELMKNGFSKQSYNEFATYCMIPALVISYLMGKLSINDTWFYMKIVIGLKFLVSLVAFILQPIGYWQVLLYVLVESLLISINTFLDGVIINTLQLNEFSAMTIAMTNSVRNFGLTGIHQMWFVGYMGHRYASMFGFLVQIVIILCLNPLIEWVKAGKQNVPQQQY